VRRGHSLVRNARKWRARQVSKADKRACAAAFKSGKSDKRRAACDEARDLFTRCRKTTCGKAVQKGCPTRLNQVMADIPTIVPLVTDESGAARIDVQVTMDGEPFDHAARRASALRRRGRCTNSRHSARTDKGVFAIPVRS